MKESKSNPSATSDTAPSKTCYGLPFDLEEAKKSNVLVSGTNSTGKSRLAMAIASKLHSEGWKVIVIDNSGVWKELSDLPHFVKVYSQIPNPCGVQVKIEIPTTSMIYDVSLLKPTEQRIFIEGLLQYIWESRVNSQPNQWLMLILEECHLVMRSVRYEVSEQLLRLMSVGRNIKARVCGITVDLALVDPSFIRLCQQRYHARLGIEEGSKRRFRAYYGSDWCKIACELDVGFFLYVLGEKIRIANIPLFQATSTPLAYQKQRKEGILAKMRRLFQ